MFQENNIDKELHGFAKIPESMVQNLDLINQKMTEVLLYELERRITWRPTQDFSSWRWHLYVMRVLQNPNKTFDWCVDPRPGASSFSHSVFFQRSKKLQETVMEMLMCMNHNERSNVYLSIPTLRLMQRWWAYSVESYFDRVLKVAT